MSGLAEASPIPSAEGVVTILQKPVKTETLLQIVRQLLDVPRGLPTLSA
jgi:hypothetical protein